MDKWVQYSKEKAVHERCASEEDLLSERRIGADSQLEKQEMSLKSEGDKWETSRYSHNVDQN